MGFEVEYSYHERDEEGNYNKEEVKTMKRLVGDVYEEVSLEKLASAIMGQLARRDVWVTDVKVHEFARKAISFRETKGGIVIKNRKFLLDNAEMFAQEIQEVPVAPQAAAPAAAQFPHNVQQASIYKEQAFPHNQELPLAERRPIKWLVFSPELPMMVEVKQRNLRFTVDKKYPIFEETPHPTGFGLAIKTVDDAGREQLMSDKYFVPANIKLSMDDELGFSDSPEDKDGGTLNWHGADYEGGMIDVRRV